ncbi:MAG: hypothetical protein IJY78_02260 [Bacteroidaceae bacterium]|nr:hypothetical protein [Bacteroidaceae bacterium]
MHKENKRAYVVPKTTIETVSAELLLQSSNLPVGGETVGFDGKKRNELDYSENETTFGDLWN